MADDLFIYLHRNNPNNYTRLLYQNKSNQHEP